MFFGDRPVVRFVGVGDGGLEFVDLRVPGDLRECHDDVVAVHVYLVSGVAEEPIGGTDCCLFHPVPEVVALTYSPHHFRRQFSWRHAHDRYSELAIWVTESHLMQFLVEETVPRVILSSDLDSYTSVWDARWMPRWCTTAEDDPDSTSGGELEARPNCSFWLLGSHVCCALRNYDRLKLKAADFRGVGFLRLQVPHLKLDRLNKGT